MRRAVFDRLVMDDRARDALTADVTWFGWRVLTLLELLIVAVIGVAMLSVAILEFCWAE